MACTYSFRNTTTSDITLNNSLVIQALSTKTVFDVDTMTVTDAWSIEHSLDGAGSGTTEIAQLLSTGSLVFVIDGIDQTSDSFYPAWKTFFGSIVATNVAESVHVLDQAGYIGTAAPKIKTNVVTTANAVDRTGFFIGPVNTTNTLTVSSTGTLISQCDRQLLYCMQPGVTPGHWFQYIDSYGSTMTPASNSALSTSVVSSGNLAVAITLLGDTTSHYPYAGVAFDFTDNGSATTANKATFNVSAYTGITITYKSSTVIKLQLEGNADSDGANWFYSLPIASTSSTVTLTWAQFSQPTWVSTTQTRAIPTAALASIKFQYDTAQAATSFTVYKVAFTGTGPFMVSPTALSKKYSVQAVQLINQWFNQFYYEDTTGTLGRIAWVSGSNVDTTITVSEGIGYGMLLAIIAAASPGVSETYRKRFDHMWAFYQLNKDGNGLMNWKVQNFNATVVGSGAAPDGDLDVAKALLLAYERFMDVSYLIAARKLMASIWTYEIISKVTTSGGTRYLIAPGDSYSSFFNPSYAKLAAIKLCAYYDNVTTHYWNTLYTDTLWFLNANQTSVGSSCFYLPSNWCDKNGTPVIGNSSLGFGWDACRVLYHVAEAFYWFGDSAARAYLQTIASTSLATTLISSPMSLQLTIKPDGTSGQSYNSTSSTWSATATSDYNTAAIGTILTALTTTSTFTEAQAESVLDTILAYTTENTDYFRLALKAFILSVITGVSTRYAKDAGSASAIAYIVNVGAPYGSQTGNAQLAIMADGSGVQVRTYSNGTWTTSSISGSQGAQGNQGPQGTSGGPQGNQGTTGAQGPQGTAGVQGVPGAQGSQGNQGNQGPANGAQGATGAQGAQGPQGFQGAQGIQGAGVQGAQGPQGNQGPANGPQGTTGSQGNQGDQGVIGTQGVPGAQGSQGNQGNQGAKGAQGTQGVQGTTGAQGVQGSIGTQGATGAQGTQGNQGFASIVVVSTMPSTPAANTLYIVTT